MTPILRVHGYVAAALLLLLLLLLGGCVHGRNPNRPTLPRCPHFNPCPGGIWMLP